MKTPCFRFTMHLEKYPASEGTAIYRWSQRPLADAGAWSEGRLFSISDIVRSSTDQDGNYELSRFTIEGSDDDGAIRTLLSTATTSVWFGREAALEVLSEAGRAANLPWRLVARGRLSSVQLKPGRRFSAEVVDLVGSQFSAFNLEKLIGVPLGAEHTNLPESSQGKIYPFVVGEHSDSGALAADGSSAEKGLLPVIDTGDYDVSGSTAPPVYGTPPTITSATVVGAGGSETFTYAAILVTPFGWSQLGNIKIVTGAAGFPGGAAIDNYVDLRISFDPGDPENVNKVVIAGRSSNPPATWLDEVDYIDRAAGLAVYFDGAKADSTPSATRDEWDVQKDLPLLLGPALVSPTVWGHLLVSIGCTDVDSIFWSDLAENAEPKRVLADPALEGMEWMTANSPQWPYPTRYLDRTNPITGETIRGTYVLVRGLRLAHHRDGVVSIAVNGCGMEETGDGSGAMVDQAFLAGQHFFNEHILKDAGTGYRSENYGPLEAYANGDAQLWTSKWQAAQDVTIARIGGLGYLAAWAIHEPIAVRELVRRFCLTFDCRLAVNHHGQIFPIVIDDLADPATGSQYREIVESVTLVDQKLAHEEIENRILYNYDFDSDAQAFRVTEQVVEDAASIAAHVPGGVVGTPAPAGIHQGPIQELYCTRDGATATDSRARRLTRNKIAPRYVTHAQDLIGLEDELGDPVLLTHRDGLGPDGDVQTDLCVLKHVVRASYGQIGTELTGIEVSRLLPPIGASVLMDDEGTLTELMGDETDPAQPTWGIAGLM